MSSESKVPSAVCELRWGIMGTGKVCQDFVSAISIEPKFKLIAVGSRTESSSKQFAQTYKVNRYYDSFEKVCTDKEVDIVYIGSIHPIHYSHLLLAINNGKHVLCEKPFTINSQQTKAVFELAAKKKVFVMEGCWNRFHPWCVKLRELLNNKVLGEISYCSADFGILFDEDNQRIKDPQLGGGALLDIGCYCVNISSLVFDEKRPEKIQSIGTLTKDEVDSQVAINLSYGPNKLSQLSCASKVDTQRELTICGSNGTIKVTDDFCWSIGTKLVLKLKGEKEQIFHFSPPPNPNKFNFFGSAMFIYEALECANCIHNGKTQSSIQSWEDTIINLEIMDEVRKQVGIKYPQHIESL